MELTAGGEADGNVFGIRGIVAAQVFVAVGEVTAKDPAILRTRREIVAHFDVHGSPSVGVERGAKIHARQYVLTIALDAYEAALPRQIHRAHDIRRIDAQHQPAELAL